MVHALEWVVHGESEVKRCYEWCSGEHMPSLIAALVQMNATVGDVTHNFNRVIRSINECRDHGAQLIVFPEMVLAGYPPEDLLFRTSFLEELERYAQEIVKASRDVMVVFGSAFRENQSVFNTAYVAINGELVTRIAKQYLPNYGVFDETRYFTPGEITEVLNGNEWSFGISVCEDLWYPDGPYLQQARQGANVLINISASPYSRGKGQIRENMMATRADDAAAYLLWTNLVGAQDELVFDGMSTVFSPSGHVLARASAFEEDVLWATLGQQAGEHRRLIDTRWRWGSLMDSLPQTLINLPQSHERTVSMSPVRARLDEDAELYHALVLGVRDYVQKNQFGDVVIGLSGGIDSALTAAIAVDALGANRVHGVLMPSEFTSAESMQDAVDLADNLGIDRQVLAIEAAMEAFAKTLSGAFSNRPRDITEENLQARIRGVLLMALSNKLGWLVLTTGNKSEMATGYSTLYGDMAGGFAVLKDVLKTEVFRLAHWRNQERERIPSNVLIKPPSAELRPDQKDEDSLPPYAILDQILQEYIENDRTIAEMVLAGIDPEYVRLAVRLVDRNEYKRRQSPVGIKVTPRAFGRDRRMPITGKF